MHLLLVFVITYALCLSAHYVSEYIKGIIKTIDTSQKASTEVVINGGICSGYIKIQVMGYIVTYMIIISTQFILLRNRLLSF